MSKKAPAGLFWLIMLLVAGCGYNLSGRGQALPHDVDSIFVAVMSNRTTEPLLETRLTTAVRDQFARRPGFEVVSSADIADAVLSGVITSYTAHAAAYDRDDDIAEYRAEMQVEFTLERRDGTEVLWHGNVRWDEEFDAHRDRAQQDNNETAAQEQLMSRLATELYNRIVDNF